MQRRTFLKSSLALSLCDRTDLSDAIRAPGTGPMEPCSAASDEAPFSAISVDCVIGEPAAAMTGVLERYAFHICQRYLSDVMLCRAGTAPINVREELACNPEASLGSAAQSARWARFADGRSRRPRIWLVDSNALDCIDRYELAPNLRMQSLTGYSLLILEDWRTYIDHAEPVTPIDDRSAAAVQRFAIATLSALQLRHYFFYAHQLGLSLAFATAQMSPGFQATAAAVQAVEEALDRLPDRRIVLGNSDLWMATSEWAFAPDMIPRHWVLSHGRTTRQSRAMLDSHDAQGRSPPELSIPYT